jgi:threonine dehydratase
LAHIASGAWPNQPLSHSYRFPEIGVAFFDIASAREAQRFLQQSLPATRLLPAPSLTSAAAPQVYLKVESDLPTGSFKVRGALYALSRRLGQGPVREVVASSTGNHGAAVAYAARQLGVAATIFVPAGANPVKLGRIAAQGGRVVEGGRDLSEAIDSASAYAAKQNACLLHDATDPDIPIGTATIGCEIVDQLPSVTTIIVPMGDTALIRGIAGAARALSPSIRIIGVQAERAPSYYLSWRQRRVVGTDSCDTIADGLATRTPIDANVRDILELVSDVRLVTEDDMLRAIRRLLIDEHVVSEPSGAAATAAFEQSRDEWRGDVVLIMSGANVTVEVLERALNA